MLSLADQSSTTTSDDAIREKLKSPRYRTYVLSMLVVVYVFNFLGRQIVTILAEPIKNDLGLNAPVQIRRPQPEALDFSSI